MLNTATMTIVKSTAPVLEKNGEILTRHFYKRMFAHNPEVLPFFNQAHQHEGRQQKALAAAICAYAANIDRLEALGGAVELIAQKHASLQVKPEHYPIVGEHLLASIREVLGEAATDDIINAWAEAYGLLTTILTGRESNIYQTQAKAPGGWEGFKSFHVIRKEKESDNITSFYLVPSDGSPIPMFKAGQYITVRVATPNGSTTMRNYSLSDKPGLPYLRISLKREEAQRSDLPHGYVSTLMHSEIDVGDSLEVGFPCGDFFLNTEETTTKPLVLIAGGVGITPVFSMLRTALESDREVVLIQASINQKVQAFKTSIDELTKKHEKLRIHYRYSDTTQAIADDFSSTGFVDGHLLDAMIKNRDADYFICGPVPFIESVQRELVQWSVPAQQIRYEFFGPRLSV